MRKPTGPSASKEDSEYFKKQMKNVRRLKTDTLAPHEKPANTKAYKPRPEREADPLDDPLSDQRDHKEVSREEFIFYAQSGVQLKTQKQLKQGLVTIEDHLDLHGLNVSQARQLLLEFINYAQKRQIRCIRLVHGKGYGASDDKAILKNKVNSWLRQHPAVIAFSSAQPRDGGTGAVYILIKKG